DFIGYKFEAAQEIANEYDQAYREQNDPAQQHDVYHQLGIISGANGQCQDMRDGYGLTRDLYRAAWLQENRPYWLDNVSAQYDMAMQLWIQRAGRFYDAARQFHRTHVLPKPEEIGLPALPAPDTAAAGTNGGASR
ncbi:MAG TPA: glycoside hydrolase, partial [Acidobacteriaceae bacterium]|nr:glycoside hydrolase [Acidobacteriaceae bacterium]